MHLFELAELGLSSAVQSVPEWAFGCFKRRSITFYAGLTDTETDVYWLQSRGLTADLRIYSGRPALADGSTIASSSSHELRAIAESEGGLARSRWDGTHMHWDAWTSFQLHEKWPEPGLLRRVGDCLIEFAPSGAYLEEWRAQPPGDGPFVGLELLDEVEAASGRVLHRGGGLVVCGSHAAFVRGRPEQLASEKTLREFAASSVRDRNRLAQLFSFEASYGRCADTAAGYRVTRSTSPWREGERLLDLEGFVYDEQHAVVVQRTHDLGVDVERRFSVDTLEPRFVGLRSTEVDAKGQAWLDREADTLLRRARRS